MLHLILASQSPRRRQLLALLGLPFVVYAANVDEGAISHSDPAKEAQLIASAKADKVAQDFSASAGDEIVIAAADTLVAIDGEPLGKPRDRSEARRMLQRLRGRQHEVHTALALRLISQKKGLNDIHTAFVTMRPYTAVEINRYVRSDDPLDKAGAYAIQNKDFNPVATLQGCYNGVMGLSVCHLHLLFSALNLPLNTQLDDLEKAHHGTDCPLFDKVIGKTK